jgi:hypothetical protein
MRRWLGRLPTLIIVGSAGLLLLHGPLVQSRTYNELADQSILCGLHHAGDVLSNIAFLIVGLWGWAILHPLRNHPALSRGWHGYRLFLLGLILAALASAFYHLAPDNQRLVLDPLSIALICAGLLAAVRAETHPSANTVRDALVLTLIAVLSVAWWQFTDGPRGQGDMRPYVLLQASPFLLVPLWQANGAATRRDRMWFGVALALYVIAKTAELFDQEIQAALGFVSGHTLKHLFAAAAAAVLIGVLRRRVTGAELAAIVAPVR